MDLVFIISLVALSVALVALVFLIFIRRRLINFEERFQQFFSAKKSPHLNAIVMRNVETVKKMSGDIDKLYLIAQRLQQVALRSTQKVGLYFYNPFGDTGGTFSFSIAMLDAEDNGLVLSSLHSRSGTQVYAKAIERGQSKHHLTGEELEALKRANK